MVKSSLRTYSMVANCRYRQQKFYLKTENYVGIIALNDGTVIEVEKGTTIYELSEEQSIEELARILGGAKITDTVMQSAIEMKELARQTK